MATFTIFDIDYFDGREVGLIKNSQIYAKNDPAGIPAHNLMLIIDKYAKLCDGMMKILSDAEIEHVIMFIADKKPKES